MAQEERFVEQLRDPFNETTRKARRNLLGSCAVGLVIIKAGLIPTKVSALGIEFTQTDQTALLRIVALIVLYYLVSFSVYAWSETVAYSVTLRIAFKKSRGEGDRGGMWLPAVARMTSLIRLFLEFVFPIVLGIYSCVVLFTGSPPTVDGASRGP